MRENGKIEEMASFFNIRAEGYEKHMQETVNSFDIYYQTVSEPIIETDEPIEILDLGCGTGLEIEGILKRAPNVRITCIDLSEGMLERLSEKYKRSINQISIINDSYVTHPFEEKKYDYVVSVMTMHHFIYGEKLNIYKKIKGALKDDGRYIEGDYVVSRENEIEYLENRNELLQSIEDKSPALYHIDIPFSMETQKSLLIDAGFNDVNVIFVQGEHQIYFAY